MHFSLRFQPSTDTLVPWPTRYRFPSETVRFCRLRVLLLTSGVWGPLYLAVRTALLGYTLKTEHRFLTRNHNLALTEPALWSSFRLISISQLNASQHLHL